MKTYFLFIYFSLSALLLSAQKQDISLLHGWKLQKESVCLSYDYGNIVEYGFSLASDCEGCELSNIKFYYMGNRIITPVHIYRGEEIGLANSMLRIGTGFTLINHGHNETCLDNSDRIETKYKLCFTYYQNGTKYFVGIPSKYLPTQKSVRTAPASDPVPVIPVRPK